MSNDPGALARMEGKIDGVNLRLDFIQKQSDLHSQRLNTHSDRLTSLENKQTLQTGERNGVSAVVKVLWAILAVLLTGGLATILAVVAALSGAFTDPPAEKTVVVEQDKPNG